ncbi:histidine phosphatase family protein [Paenibacillus pasadenensis]|uniref:histidine phosphatase family protein n=1 Tax=Paenibacillus pasadenensis TaxID=217090 RepID=UPI00203C03EE|nr:histidine phosphatase family protein [Paenibacillus pasadenensis]
MKKVYVVRHCKAEGQEPEAPLTATGVEQAERLAEFLSDKNVDRIISSPFERAVHTITPLADKLAVRIELDQRLAERILSGTPNSDWLEMLRLTYDDLELCYEGGESSRAAMNRAVRVVVGALDSDSSNIVLVSHGNLISLLLKYFDDRIGFQEWKAFSNPDVFLLKFSGNKDKPIVNRIWTE